MAHVTRRSIGAHGYVEMARGEPVSERGSVFTAQIAWPVKSVAAANAAIALMRQQSHASCADHNMSAFIVGGKKGQKKGGKRVEKAYEDDGEARLGQRLLGSLTKQGACDVAAVVSRVYGGENIGKRRFEIVADTAATLLGQVGHVPGVGICHSWGSGNVLGGSSPAADGGAAAGPSSSGGGGSGGGGSRSGGGGSGSKKRKMSAADAAEEEAQRRAAQREAMAMAAERRAQSQTVMHDAGGALIVD